MNIAPVARQPKKVSQSLIHCDAILLLLESLTMRFNEVAGDDALFEYVEGIHTLPWDDPVFHGLKVLLRSSIHDFERHYCEVDHAERIGFIVKTYSGILQDRFFETYGVDSAAFPYEINIEQYLYRCLDVFSDPIPF